MSYPAASDSDFNFCRELLNGGEVPDDVWIQVGLQSPVDSASRRLTPSPGAHPSKNRPHQAHIRGRRGSQARHHPHVQRDVVSLPRSRLQQQSRRNRPVGTTWWLRSPFVGSLRPTPSWFASWHSNMPSRTEPTFDSSTRPRRFLRPRPSTPSRCARRSKRHGLPGTRAFGRMDGTRSALSL